MREQFLFRSFFVIFLLSTIEMYSQNQTKGTAAWGDNTTWKSEASTGNWNADNWYNLTQGWDNHNPNYEGGRQLSFNNNNQLSMINDFTGNGVNRWQILFSAGATQTRTILGSTENIFYDNGGTSPKIENLSTANHILSFPMKASYSPFELNPINGDITITSEINTNGNFIDVYGNNSKQLIISSNITGTGGLVIKENSTVIFSTTSKTYSGFTLLEAGTLELQGSLANSDVTVASGATLRINGTNVTVKSLTVNAGGNVEIEPGKSLTVTGALANSGTLRINSDASATGSLITNGTVSGNATIERYIGAWGTAAQGWHFLSSPVAGQSFQPEFVPNPPTVNEDFYLWDEPGSQWVNSKSGSDPFTFNEGAFGTTFVTGKGYLVSYASNFTKNFVGVPNTSSVSDIALTYTPASAAKGWNLLGNPFPSALTWNIETWKPGNLTISGTAKIVKSADASYEDITAGEVIPTMNGFFVYTSASTTLTIPAGSRTHGSDWFKQTSTLSKFILKVIDLDGQTAQKTQLILNPDASAGFDFLYDSEFLPFLAPSLYTVVEGKQLSTNSIPAITGNLLVPVHFVKNNGSNFVLEAENVSAFGTEINLVDKKTGIVTNLNQNPTYSFTSENSDDPARFDLHFGLVGLSEQTQSTQLKAYASNGRLYFPLKGDATLEVIDLQGRKLTQTKMSGTGLTSHPMSLTAGAYIVRLRSETGIQTAKVIVK